MPVSCIAQALMRGATRMHAPMAHARAPLLQLVAPCNQYTAPLARRMVAAAASAGTPSLVERIKEDMKAAMRAKDQARLDAIRLLSAAVKQREIELREAKGVVDDVEVVKVLNKMAKQRKDSIEMYKSGGRQDLVDKEAQELSVLESYLPQMMTQQEVATVVEEVIKEVGATSPKQMGAVMKALGPRIAGRADNKTVSDIVKAKLGPAKK